MTLPPSLAASWRPLLARGHGFGVSLRWLSAHGHGFRSDITHLAQVLPGLSGCLWVASVCVAWSAFAWVAR